jgi:phosphatidylinositol-bisphosphatase
MHKHQRGVCESSSTLTHVLIIVHECLDTGHQFPSPGEERGPLATAITSILVQLLDSLVDPVVPPYLHARCLQMSSRDEAFEVCQTKL